MLIFSSLTYLYELTHLVVDQLFKLSFLQLALVTRVFVENFDNRDHAVLQVRHIVRLSLKQSKANSNHPPHTVLLCMFLNI